MNPTFILITSRRILQTTGIDAFYAIPETSNSPTSAVRRPIGSSMALTILILLAALFFLGFFSIYIRRFTAAAEAPSNSSSAEQSKGGGLDISAVNSLPLVAYGRAAKHRIIGDCPICLCEFHEREPVKLVPYCGHVFHPSCIDTWLALHVTCPLCRSAELFKRVEEVSLSVAPDGNHNRAPDIAEASTVENCGARETGGRSTAENDGT